MKLNELLSAHHDKSAESHDADGDSGDSGAFTAATNNDATDCVETKPSKQSKIKRTTAGGASASIIAQLTEDLNKQEMAKVQAKLQEVIFNYSQL
jgi:hypothetical protein